MASMCPNGHAASMTGGRPGVLHGNRTYLLQDDDGQILEGHSISAGLDYPGVGPEHSWLRDSGRVTYVPVTDKEALEAFQICTRMEGIIPALESAHGLCAGDAARPDDEQGRGDRPLPLGPRRQGHRVGGQAHRDGVLMPTRIDQRFAACAAENRPALVTFIMAGDPDLETSAAASRGAAAAPGPTSSSSACRSPIRWPMGR